MQEETTFLEIAESEIKPGAGSAFEAGVREAEPLFLRAKECHGVELHRTVEHLSRYKLVVQWETVEDHHARHTVQTAV